MKLRQEELVSIEVGRLGSCRGRLGQGEPVRNELRRLGSRVDLRETEAGGASQKRVEEAGELCE